LPRASVAMAEWMDRSWKERPAGGSERPATHRFGSAVDSIWSAVDRFRPVGRRFVPRSEVGARTV